MKKLFLLIVATVGLFAGTMSCPTDGTIKVLDDEVTGVACFQNRSHFDLAYSTNPLTGTNIGALAAGGDNVCFAVIENVYFKAKHTVNVQCWAARP